MYRPYKYIRRGGRTNSRGFKFDCRIACSSSKQLEQHLNGTKHKMALYESSNEVEENTFPLDNMVVLDQTEDDISNDNAASPASCDSSDSATAACPLDFQTIDCIPTSHMVILDETNDDNDHPASPASCESASEFAPSSPGTVKMSDVSPEEKTRIEIPEDDQCAPESPHCALSSCPSTSSVPEEAGTSDKYYSEEHHSKSSKTVHKQFKKTFHIQPIKSNQDVIQFLKTFAVANDSDVAFAKKVTKLFSNALRKYNEIQLEEIICTEEAEHGSPEELGSSNLEQTNSVPCTTVRSESESVNSAPSSPTDSSLAQCISIPMSSADCKPDSPIINQSDNSSIASQSPTNRCEDIDTSDKPSTTNSTNDNSCSAIEGDLLMESEHCLTAEAACSDDEDV
ncbi:dentin sialophosphoprotein-like isoform X2 [Dendropsophus ebraccatus]|uniref:dentin sialophosphoprotein-like isoform X2 n=1 Tax=Dendropsophus ebraccatus TaxID=150705 RepID=UPI00383100C9